MPDREKVINGLRICFIQKDCDGCPYQKELKAILDKPHNDDWRCPILDDALALLKEQEEKQTPKPIVHGGMEEYWGEEEICPDCGKRWQSSDINTTRFCPGCGRAVFWNDSDV